MSDVVGNEDGESHSTSAVKSNVSRRSQWKSADPTNPDENHAANDRIMPNDLSKWMSEDEFMAYVDENCAKGYDGEWKLGEPKADSRGFLRIRAVHDTLKSQRYMINTPPIRCRYIVLSVPEQTSEEEEPVRDKILISRVSLDEFIKKSGPDLGLSTSYPDIFSNDEHSVPPVVVKPEKPPRKRPSSEGNESKAKKSKKSTDEE